MTKILKNTTISDISIPDTGVTIPASGQYIIPPQDYLLWASSEDITAHVTSEDVVVNDGVKDLSVKLGFAYLFDLEQRPKNTITVSKDSAQNGDYSTIKEAIEAVTSPSTIVIHPGVYIEDNSLGPIALKTGITVKTQGHGTVTIEPQDPNQDLFLVNQESCRFQGLAIRNVTGARAICITSSTLPAIFDYITISNCQVPVCVESSTDKTQAVFRNLRLISGSTTTQLMKVTSANGFDSIVRIYSAIFTDDDGTTFQDGILVSGPNARIDPNTLLMRSTVGVGNGLAIQDGASLVVQAGFEIDGFDKNLISKNIGSAPTMFVSACTLSNGVTSDLEINHPTTHGDVWGILRLSKFINNSPENFTIGYQDPETGDINSNRIIATRGFSTEVNPITTFNGTIQLVSFDPNTNVFTGSTAGTITRLPDATTLRKGHRFWFLNISNVVVTIQRHGGSDPLSLTQNTAARYILFDNSTQAGVWARETTSAASAVGVTPPFIFSKSGGAGVGAYLKTGEVDTSKTGQFIKGENFIVEIKATNSVDIGSPTGAIFQIQRRTGLNTFTDISGATVTIPPDQFQGTNTGLLIPIGPDWEISCYNSGPRNATDPVVTLFLIPK